MKLKLLFFVQLFLLSICLQGHEHWLYVEPAAVSVGDSIQVSISSGHQLGDSDFLIPPKLIRETFVITPSGSRIPLDLHVEGGQHISRFLAGEAGVYTVFVNLRKRPRGPYDYLLKTRVKVDMVQPVAELPHDQELEVVLDENQRSVQVFSGRESIKTPIQIMTTDREAPKSLIMDRTGASSLEGYQGFCVIISHFRRQTTSYAFYLEP